MAFQLRDETANINVLYIDNAGNAGLGVFPFSNTALSAANMALVDPSGYFEGGLVVPGTPITTVGAVTVGAGMTTPVNINFIQAPTVTASQPPVSVTPTSVSWANTGTSDITVNYSLW